MLLWSSPPTVAAHVLLVTACIALAIIDVRTHRLPHAIVIPSTVVSLILLAVGAWVSDGPRRFTDAAIGMLAYCTLFAIVRTVRPDAMGGGDVTLAALLGLFLGHAGLDRLGIGIIAALVLGGVHALTVLVLPSASRSTRIPFGPWMIAGAWAALLIDGGAAAAG